MPAKNKLSKDLLLFATEVKTEIINSIEPIFVEIKDEIGGLKGRMGTLENEVGGLKSEVGGLRGGVQDLRGEVGELREEVRDSRGEVRDLRGDVGGLRGEVHDLRGDMVTMDNKISWQGTIIAAVQKDVKVALEAQNKILAHETIVKNHEKRIAKLEKSRSPS